MKLIELSVPRLAVEAFPPAGLESGGLDKGQGTETHRPGGSGLVGFGPRLTGTTVGEPPTKVQPFGIIAFFIYSIFSISSH